MGMCVPRDIGSPQFEECSSGLRVYSLYILIFCSPYARFTCVKVLHVFKHRRYILQKECLKRTALVCLLCGDV